MYKQTNDTDHMRSKKNLVVVVNAVAILSVGKKGVGLDLEIEGRNLPVERKDGTGDLLGKLNCGWLG